MSYPRSNSDKGCAWCEREMFLDIFLTIYPGDHLAWMERP